MILLLRKGYAEMYSLFSWLFASDFDGWRVYIKLGILFLISLNKKIDGSKQED